MARRKGWLKRRFRLRLKKDAAFSIAYMLLFCLAFLISLSFTRQGAILLQLNNFLLGVFGWGVIFLVFFLLLSGLMLTRFNVPWNQAGVLAGGTLMAASLMGLTRSGLLGRMIFEQIVYLITPVGTYVVLTISTIIGFIVFFNTSFDQVIGFLINIFKSIKGLFCFRGKKEPQFVQENVGLDRRAMAKHEVAVAKRSGKTNTEKEAEEFPTNTAVPGAQSSVWNYPPLSLLSDFSGGKADRGDVKANAATIEKTLDSFGISARVVEVNDGPAVTQYAIEVALGTKLSKITGLSNDLALALAAPTGQIRVEAPIPGRSMVGLELPNRSLEVVTLKQILGSEAMKDRRSKLIVPLGLDVSGKPIVGNMAKMPHVLIAGQTGSGKSVLLNSWISSFLFRTTPSEVKLILIDPKRVEFTQYAGVPHLFTPVIVEKDKIVHALEWATAEMDRRYKLFAQVGARNIETYNEMSGFQTLPYLVIVIDELADIIFFAPARVEDAICRIAQMARATGIHLVIATQRPSVDVLTGLIKANIPCRISFAVSSMIDSRVILDTPGAEKLLGRGDMLYTPPDQAKPTRIQGAYVSDAEIKNLLEFLNKTGVRPVYTEEVTEAGSSGSIRAEGGSGGEKDPLFIEAVRMVCLDKRASASLFQRKFAIGYARAARLLDRLQEVGAVGPGEGAKPREILISNADEFLASMQQ
ncbi:DNA translocase FtsK [Candidatus Shapirobacteria bacterium CG09_land_8_20_14_0_10_39_12]|uniref:DNA translocase FtsK n=1 Tax=Candidatus Shapirobacteria bacterium CG09_land_8_20_14_0_10_39_12 TaxID=1974885 RepID=A0A2H0WPP7_9BACT|nr:MAG: DNA translocase FtsK [Candidatus Shapirobacteria bacterium CG09_land_8_20_14_0_10_39_12]